MAKRKIVVETDNSSWQAPKKRKKRKMNTHKRKKRLRANRHKKKNV